MQNACIVAGLVLKSSHRPKTSSKAVYVRIIPLAAAHVLHEALRYRYPSILQLSESSISISVPASSAGTPR